MRRAGEVIGGRYRIVAAIGRGGMGDVYRAVDEKLHREVALKLVRPEPKTLLASERFQREARAIAQIRDPHVVAAYDFGDEGECSYLTMELSTGCSVGEELRESGPFTAARAQYVVRQAAAGLAAAHRVGVVHRDVKPDNLLLGDDGSVKVADFGIARFLHDATTTMTSSGEVVGTSYYLSPEAALGRRVGPAADIYALGCVLYQLVTGHPPFMAEEPAAIMYQHVEREPVPPSDLRPELAGELEDLIFWMLAKDPDSRPTAEQVATGARPPRRVDQNTVVTTVLPARRSRRKVLLPAGLATFALAASLGVGLALHNGGGQAPATTNFAPQETVSTPKVLATTTTPPPSRRPTTPPTAAVVRKPDRTKAATSTSAATKSAKPDKPEQTKTKKPKKTKEPKHPKP
ncbi:serine/threonine-protein kinase [Kribbella sp. NPDC005582]|uniref:serine/threonine-protein kinase n=1 Tax=Kribbella sp. NPDC005582 TaxID=3156893 RepID=UPI0033A039A7